MCGQYRTGTQSSSEERHFLAAEAEEEVQTFVITDSHKGNTRQIYSLCRTSTVNTRITTLHTVIIIPRNKFTIILEVRNVARRNLRKGFLLDTGCFPQRARHFYKISCHSVESEPPLSQMANTARTLIYVVSVPRGLLRRRIPLYQLRPLYGGRQTRARG